MATSDRSPTDPGPEALPFAMPPGARNLLDVRERHPRNHPPPQGPRFGILVAWARFHDEGAVLAKLLLLPLRNRLGLNLGQLEGRPRVAGGVRLDDVNPLRESPTGVSVCVALFGEDDSRMVLQEMRLFQKASMMAHKSGAQSHAQTCLKNVCLKLLITEAIGRMQGSAAMQQLQSRRAVTMQ